MKTRRDSKAGLSFVNVSDGSCFHPVQVVAPSTLSNYSDEVQRLTAGCAVEATGVIVPLPTCSSKAWRRRIACAAGFFVFPGGAARSRVMAAWPGGQRDRGGGAAFLPTIRPA
ncbi:hypothetical protein [Rhodoferax sp.]|uniref:hypothetical protein n=1 Tax=Rhodoferax sp. TaxID=50421 RepID=UPI00345BDBCD